MDTTTVEPEVSTTSGGQVLPDTPEAPAAPVITKTQETTPVVGINSLEEAQKVIADLRAENAKYRTRSKTLEEQLGSVNERFTKFETGLKSMFGEEDDSLTPEQRVEHLTGQNEEMAINQALTEAALEFGVGRESYDYFRFLVSERLQSLGEGEEITEEDLEAIAKSAGAKGGMTTTSVDGVQVPAPEVPGGTTLEEFQVMGINARSLLFRDNPVLYKQLLMSEQAATKKA